jgi:hypothetical protein
MDGPRIERRSVQCVSVCMFIRYLFEQMFTQIIVHITRVYSYVHYLFIFFSRNNIVLLIKDLSPTGNDLETLS